MCNIELDFLPSTELDLDFTLVQVQSCLASPWMRQNEIGENETRSGPRRSTVIRGGPRSMVESVMPYSLSLSSAPKAQLAGFALYGPEVKVVRTLSPPRPADLESRFRPRNPAFSRFSRPLAIASKRARARTS